MKLRLFWKIYTFFDLLIEKFIDNISQIIYNISQGHITMFQKNQISPSFKQKIYHFV